MTRRPNSLIVTMVTLSASAPRSVKKAAIDLARSSAINRMSPSSRVPRPVCMSHEEWSMVMTSAPTFRPDHPSRLGKGVAQIGSGVVGPVLGLRWRPGARAPTRRRCPSRPGPPCRGDRRPRSRWSSGQRPAGSWRCSGRRPGPRRRPVPTGSPAIRRSRSPVRRSRPAPRRTGHRGRSSRSSGSAIRSAPWSRGWPPRPRRSRRSASGWAP